MSEDLIEQVARAMAVALGRDPDEIHTIGMGDQERSVPYWKMQCEWAIRHIAAESVLRAPRPDTELSVSVSVDEGCKLHASVAEAEK